MSGQPAHRRRHTLVPAAIAICAIRYELMNSNPTSTCKRGTLFGLLSVLCGLQLLCWRLEVVVKQVKP